MSFTDVFIRRPVLASVARSRGVTVSQVAIAWLLARSPTVAPIPGTGSLAQTLSTSSLAAAPQLLGVARAVPDAPGPAEALTAARAVESGPGSARESMFNSMRACILPRPCGRSAPRR